MRGEYSIVWSTVICKAVRIFDIELSISTKIEISNIDMEGFLDLISIVFRYERYYDYSFSHLIENYLLAQFCQGFFRILFVKK